MRWLRLQLLLFVFIGHSLLAEYVRDDSAGEVVEEDDEEGDEKHEEEALQDRPLVVLPDYVFERFQRVHEPHEWSVRPAEQAKYHNKKLFTQSRKKLE